MKEKSLSKNFAYNTLYQILLYAVPFVTTPYLSRVLGNERIGQYSFAQSLVSYFVLAATLGTTLYGQRKISATRNEPTAQVQCFWEIVSLRAITVTIAMTAYALFVLPLCGDWRLYLVASIEVAAVALDISWFFQGNEAFGVITACNGACKLLSLALVFTLVKDPGDLNVYVVIYCGATAAGNLAQWLRLPSVLPKARAGGLHCFRHLKPALALFVAQVAIQIYTVLDKTMIGVITGSDAQNGYYEQAQRIIRVLTALTTSIGTVMASRIAILWKERRSDEIQGLLEGSFQIVFAIGMPIIVGLWVVAPRFVPIFYGDGYEDVVPLLRVLVALILIVGCSNVIGTQYLVPTGKERYMTRSVMVGAAVNFCLNGFLIGKYLAVGAAAASVIAECCVTAVQLYTVRKEIDIRPVIRSFFRYSVMAAGMGILALLLDRRMPQGIAGLAAVVVLCAALYLAELAAAKDPALKFMSETVKRH